MKRLRGREADDARCHFCCCAALCLGFSVVQYIIRHLLRQIQTSKRNPNKSPSDSPTAFVNEVKMTHPIMNEV